MADWFKFYDNGMDEPRFRYALRTLSAVCPVWLLTLSECCRHRSDTFPWSGDEVDLIGWSEKACISPPLVNESMNLLTKIRYIIIKDGYLTVLNWNKLQSDYCRKSSKPTTDTVRTVSGQTPESVPLEERRVEEKREERIEEKESLSSGKPDSAEMAILTQSRIVLHYLNEKAARHYREVAANLLFIKQRLEEPDVTVEGIKVMIDRQVARWKGTDYDKYLRPQTLFNRSKFADYYDNREMPVEGAGVKPNHAGGF